MGAATEEFHATLASRCPRSVFLWAMPAAAERPVKVLDLGHPLSDADPTWTGGKAFSRTETATFAKDGAAMGKLSNDEHFGTHLDAPAHFGGSWTTDKIPVDRSCGPRCASTSRPRRPPTRTIA